MLADRYPRIRIAQATQIAAAMQAGTLALLTLSGQLDIWILLLLMLLQGVIFSLWQPVRLALISSLVPREDLGSAVALNSVIFNSARFIGPALAGVLLVAGGAGWVLYCIPVVCLVSGLPCRACTSRKNLFWWYLAGGLAVNCWTVSVTLSATPAWGRCWYC
ncbi:MAG: MFS transporter [Gammaproteobacteria bacterium]